MRRILIIDDQAQVRTAVSLALRAKGFEVETAENGHAGLRAFKASAFDLVIADIFMPEMDGVKLIKTLRERNPRLPVIAVSGVQLRDSGHTALDLFPLAPDLSGIVCLQKPFGPVELMRAIAAATATEAAKSPAVHKPETERSPATGPERSEPAWGHGNDTHLDCR
jgi:CheY-like chemotaxis protein